MGTEEIEKLEGESEKIVEYTLGLGNRLSSWGDNPPSPFGTTARQDGVARYNTAGCLTNFVSNINNRELNLSWDERYQLTSVDSVNSNEVGGKVSYDYNVLGQRISRKEVSGTITNIEYYVHDGVNVIADLDEDKELLRSYSYAPGYDNIISMTTYGDETNTYFYIRNHVNSVVALIDENGDIAESYEYSAYGEVTVFDVNGNELDESALGNRYTFQGREIDWSTELYNFRARWYDAETGRWLSKDPIGINGGLNQYVFCGNNPVMFGDPEGLWSLYRLIYTGDPNAPDDVYDAALEEATDYLFNDGGCRGVYFGVGTEFIKNDATGSAAYGGIRGNWTMDDGFSVAGDVGFGLREANGTGGIGVGGFYDFYSTKDGWKSVAEGGSIGVYGGKGNSKTGGSFAIDDIDNVGIGLNYGAFYGGIIIDPKRVVQNYKDSWDCITDWFD